MVYLGLAGAAVVLLASGSPEPATAIAVVAAAVGSVRCGWQCGFQGETLQSKQR